MRNKYAGLCLVISQAFITCSKALIAVADRLNNHAGAWTKRARAVLDAYRE